MARKTVYLHGGATKTGSSALQVWFARNIDELRRAGIHYPAPPRLKEVIDGRVATGNAGAIARFVRPDSVRPRLPKENVFNRVDAALSTDCDKVLFSTETIQSGTKHRFAELKEYIGRRGADVVVIFVVRNVADHAFSIWGQSIKRAGSTIEWDEALQRYRAPFLRSLNAVANGFGHDAIVVLNYNTLKRDLVGGFLRALGVSSVPYKPIENVNRSLSAKEISYMLFINRRLAEMGTDVTLTNRSSTLLSDWLLRTCASPPLELSLAREQYAILERNNAVIVEEINRTFLPNDPIEIGRPDQISEAIEIEPLTEVDQAIAAKLAELLPATVHHRLRERKPAQSAEVDGSKSYRFTEAGLHR